MQHHHILYGAVVTLVATLCLSITAAAPQTQLPSTSKLISQIASDSIGFDSGLWRSEYLQPPKQNDDAGDSSAPEVLESATTSGATRNPTPAFVYSDQLITRPLDIPAVIETHGMPADADADADAEQQGDTAMSEWENAEAESGGQVKPGSTASGPSLTSAIVGFAGIMIVIGAYVSSGKRNR